jgi:hypothetical protein
MVKYDTDKTSIAPINLDLAEKVNRVFFPLRQTGILL